MEGKEFHVRIITTDFSVQTENEIFVFLEKLKINILTYSFQKYFKIEGCGELNIDFQMLEIDIEWLKNKLSSVWENDVTDGRWANIYCPKTSFIWFVY